MPVSGEMVASFAARDPSPCLFHRLTSFFFFFFQGSILLPLTQGMTQRKYSTTTTMIEVKLERAKDYGPNSIG